MRYLTEQPISWDRVAIIEREAGGPQSGALVTFLGTVRNDRHGGRRVQTLCYEAYTDMAERLIERLVAETQVRWVLSRVQVLHRLGVVEVGQISVMILVTAPHRQEAYAASQFLIERIKSHVPIWKRESYEDGTSQWAGCPEEAARMSEQEERAHSHV